MAESLSPVNIINESPYIATGITASCATLLFVRKKIRIILAVIILIVILFMSWFYRRPINTIKTDLNAGDIISPAFGTVYEILPVEKDGIQYTHISIFLSPADVHVQYIPMNCTFVETKYDATGKFNLAYEMNKSNENEKSITTLAPSVQGNLIYVTQIAGYLVRRINTKLFKPGEELKAGQELGMIKFGSRVDIEIPTDEYEILVKEGQYLYGPDTKLAKLKENF